MSFLTVLFVGTGAIGGFFASRLASVANIKVSTVCRSNYNAVRSNGIRVTSPLFSDTTFRPENVFASIDEAKSTKKEQNMSFDYFFISTKVLPELGDPSALLEGLVDQDSCIVLSQNGLGIEQPYRERFPKSTIISATTRTSVQQLSANHVRHNHWTRTTMGPYSPRADVRGQKAAQKQTKQFAELLNAAGIHDIDLLDHDGMQFARWHKTAINAAMNPTAVLAGGPTNQTMALDDELYAHMAGVMREILSAAENALGKPLPESLPKVEDILDGVKDDVSGSRPSMWLDWENGRRVELEAILGEPLRQAKAVGIDLPRTQTLYSLLRRAQVMRHGQ